MTANLAAAGNGAVASLLQFAARRRAMPELRRWAIPEQAVEMAISVFAGWGRWGSVDAVSQ